MSFTPWSTAIGSNLKLTAKLELPEIPISRVKIPKTRYKVQRPLAADTKRETTCGLLADDKKRSEHASEYLILDEKW
ncbi:hypothetical protein CFBP6626_18025 [Agrobacterium tumefaciens]|nr:hypothetical protein CFBP6626_18025 [Agrobacterium tumefaciens]